MTTTVEQKKSYIKGGSFLVEDRRPQEVYTPEEFTEEQQMMATTVEEFMRQEVLPRVTDLETKKVETNRELLRKMAPLGLLGIDIPAKYGGMELDKRTTTLIAEQLALDGSFSASHGAHTGIGSWPIIFYGTEEQKQKYLPKLNSGEMLSSYALTEPHCGSDAMAIKAKAVKSPDGKYWILNGTKMFITNGGFADLFIVFAKVDGEKITCFIVERAFPGLSNGAEEHKMGIKGSSTTTVILEDCKVPVENLLGEIGKGHKIAFNCLNLGRFKLGVGAIGGSKHVLAMATRYAKERTAFGRPIADFGLIREKLAEMATRIYAGESMVYRTAGLIDSLLEGVDHASAEGAQQILQGIEEYAVECSMLKVMGSEILDYCCDEAVQVYGGYGYVADYPVERGYRDARINRIFEGTNEINRLLIPGMMLRRAMKGDLPLIPAAMKLMEEIMSLPSLEEDEGEWLAAEKKIVKNLKKVALMAAGSAVQKYRDKIADQQEVMGNLANLIMETFACESALLRALKGVSAKGEAANPLPVALTRTYLNDAVARVDAAAKNVLAAISEGDTLRMSLAALKRFTKWTPINTVELRQRIAQQVIEAERYPLA